MINTVRITSIACGLIVATATIAEEGGSAHYLPAAKASFVDAFPGKPDGVAALNDFTHYNASAPAHQTLPQGGLLASTVDATVYADALAAIHQAPWESLVGGMDFGIAAPYARMEPR